jgi:hypothetical protein
VLTIKGPKKLFFSQNSFVDMYKNVYHHQFASSKELNFKIHPAGSYKGAAYGDVEVVILCPDSWYEASRSNIMLRGQKVLTPPRAL